MKHLVRPEHGAPIDHAGKAVTTEPVEGGVRIENVSLPLDHEARVVYRELTADEKREQKRSHEEWVGFLRADAWLFLRLERDRLLRATDHVELASFEEREGKPVAVAWRAWRQKLRDLPAKTKDPDDVKWPTPPAATSALLEQRRLFPDLDWSPLLS